MLSPAISCDLLPSCTVSCCLPPSRTVSHCLLAFSLAMPSHYNYLKYIILTLILWLFSQPCSSHSSLSFTSLDTVVTILSLFYPVLLYYCTYHYATWAMVTWTLATTWVCLNYSLGAPTHLEHILTCSMHSLGAHTHLGHTLTWSTLLP